MFKIVDKKQLTPLIYSLWVEAPRIASSAKPGQFLIVRTGENGERIPLTICDYDTEKGTVRIVVQIAGVSSNKLCRLDDSIRAVLFDGLPVAGKGGGGDCAAL